MDDASEECRRTRHNIHRLLSKMSPGWPKARSPLRKDAIARCVTMYLLQIIMRVRFEAQRLR